MKPRRRLVGDTGPSSSSRSSLSAPSRMHRRQQPALLRPTASMPMSCTGGAAKVFHALPALQAPAFVACAPAPDRRYCGLTSRRGAKLALFGPDTPLWTLLGRPPVPPRLTLCWKATPTLFVPPPALLPLPAPFRPPFAIAIKMLLGAPYHHSDGIPVAHLG